MENVFSRYVGLCIRDKSSRHVVGLCIGVNSLCLTLKQRCVTISQTSDFDAEITQMGGRRLELGEEIVPRARARALKCSINAIGCRMEIYAKN